MGKFVIKRTKSRGFMFNLVASNGEVIATSEVYTQKPKCKVGIQSVMKNCVAQVEDQTKENYPELSNPKFQVYKDKRGEFRFRLLATNGRNIAASEGYTTHAACLNGIESVKKNAPEAPIDDKSLLKDAEVKS